MKLDPEFCKSCLSKICDTLSAEAKEVLKIIESFDTINRTEIQNQVQAVGLSYAITGNAIMELVHKLLVEKHKVENTNMVAHNITKNGERVSRKLFIDDEYWYEGKVPEDKVVDE